MVTRGAKEPGLPGWASSEYGGRDGTHAAGRRPQRITGHVRAAWQKASRYTKRAQAKAATGRFKQVIGDGPRPRTDQRRASEVGLARCPVAATALHGTCCSELGRVVSDFGAVPTFYGAGQ